MMQLMYSHQELECFVLAALMNGGATPDAFDVIAKRARGGLQQRLAEMQRQLATSETGRVSALAAASQAKAEAGILLAQLLGEADDLAGKFAEEADERYVAGSTCERTYEAITLQR